MKTIKKTLALLYFLFSITIANAETTNVRYQGEILAGYGVGIGTFGMDRFSLQTVHGIKAGKYFSAGLGVGANIYTKYVYDLPEVYMPIFLNVKGYLPVTPQVSFFLSADMGYSFGLTEGVNEMSGLTFTPAIGANFNISPRNAINIRLGYDCQRWESSFSGFGINDNALSIRLGFQF